MDDVDFGHGFLPRVGTRNHAAVERCLAGASHNMFGPDLALPWAIAEPGWAAAEPALLRHRAESGLRFMVDPEAWRFREQATFESPPWRDVPYAPPEPLQARAAEIVREFTRRCLEWQHAVGCDVLLVPGFLPRDKHDTEAADLTLLALDAASDVALAAGTPMIAFVGVHSSSLSAAPELLDAIPHTVHGVYLQVTPVKPLAASPEALIQLCRTYAYARHAGFSVIAGRMGAVGRFLRACGIDAADCGLAEGEQFSLWEKLRNQPTLRSGETPVRIPGGRVYSSQLGRSFSAAEWRVITGLRAVAAELLCNLPCCTFQTVRQTPARAHDHALWARATDALSLDAHPRGERLGQELVSIEAKQSLLRQVNTALLADGGRPLDGAYLDNRAAACRRLLSAGWVAA